MRVAQIPEPVPQDTVHTVRLRPMERVCRPVLPFPLLELLFFHRILVQNGKYLVNREISSMVVDGLLVDDRGCFYFGIFIQGHLSGLKETQVVPLSGQNIPKQKVDVLCTHYVVLIVVMLSRHKRLGYPLVLLVLVNVTVIEVLILNLTLLRLPLFFVLPHLDIFKHSDSVVSMFA